ncbi:MAG: hypothetical protein MUE73_09050 [Planctomycetes bacterium]|nr:hypothetical protein [Planctomycetota bacterium]
MRQFALPAGCLFLLSLVAPASGDIAPEPEFGQSLAPREKTAVAMTAEEVTVTLAPEKALVRAVFHLENRGEGTSLEVGFPDVVSPASWSSNAPPEGVRRRMLRDFRVTVDGRETEARHRWLRESESPFGKAGSGRDGWLMAGWLLFDMTFARGQKRDVEVTYWVPYRPLYRPDLLGTRQFEYVLVTGAAWKGSIGKAIIDIRFAEGLTRGHLGEVTPAGHVETKEGIRWSLADLEPTEDVRIAVRKYAGFAAAAEGYLASAAESAEQGKPDAAGLWLARAAECLDRLERFEESVAVCRRIAAMERAAREGKPGPKQVKLFWKDRYVPWECRVVRGLVRLGREAEAREAAKEAVAVIRTVLADPKSKRFVDEAGLAAIAARLESFIAGEAYPE